VIFGCSELSAPLFVFFAESLLKLDGMLIAIERAHTVQ
jgi:hypothetical protein